MTPQEVTDLLNKLATNITLQQQQQEEGQQNHCSNPSSLTSSTEIDLSLSELTNSLNLTDSSNTTLSNTALSLLCFTAPQLYDSVIEYSVKTIVSVLSGSITCDVLRLGDGEVLQVGSSISPRVCWELVESVGHVIAALDAQGRPTSSLLRAVVRAAVSISCCRYPDQAAPTLDVQSVDRKFTSISQLFGHLPREFAVNNGEIPFRLLIWYFDPLVLKDDISKILQETMRRPFLSLSREFNEKPEWHSILLCLMCSPGMFINTRALLHRWFLQTGLGFILELLVELVSMVLDVITRPTFWGILDELGSKLPFFHAYFPFKSQLLRALAGPLSSENFKLLVNKTSESSCIEAKVAVNHRSNWALAVNFPDWFDFASALLFSGNSFPDLSHFRSHEPDIGQVCGIAAMYIAWILNPVSVTEQALLCNGLNKLSESWTEKQSELGTGNKQSGGYWKKLEKPKFGDKNNNLTPGNGYEFLLVIDWLKEFDTFIRSVGIGSHCTLFRRTLTGIVIGWPNYNYGSAWELLLHYAATGTMLDSLPTKNSKTRHLKQNSTNGLSECTLKEAIAGVHLVFRLTDAVERISASLFETEESQLENVSRVKRRVCSYLIKCTMRTIELSVGEDGFLVLIDLQERLTQWKHQGREVIEVRESLDYVIECLNHKLSSEESTRFAPIMPVSVGIWEIKCFQWSTERSRSFSGKDMRALHDVD